MKLLMCSLLQPPATSSLLGPNILLSTLFPNTLNVCSSLSVTNQISHPYKTEGKIIFYYILIFKFLDTCREDKKNSEQSGSRHSPGGAPESVWTWRRRGIYSGSVLKIRKTIAHNED
jgi:hypothetical protein